MLDLHSGTSRVEKLGLFCGLIINSKGAFTLARFRARFRTKLAHSEMKNIFLNFAKHAKARAKIANVNAP
jgi:hypothetical protein